MTRPRKVSRNPLDLLEERRGKNPNNCGWCRRGGRILYKPYGMCFECVIKFDQKLKNWQRRNQREE